MRPIEQKENILSSAASAGKLWAEMRKIGSQRDAVAKLSNPNALARVKRNLETLRSAASAFPAVTVLPVEGGWSAVMQVPSVMTEEALVLALLEHDDLLVHPGYFFDFPREAFVVVSLLVSLFRR